MSYASGHGETFAEGAAASCPIRSDFERSGRPGCCSTLEFVIPRRPVVSGALLAILACNGGEIAHVASDP
jgi:hypothetical protein